MGELTSITEADHPTEVDTPKIPGWFPDDIAERTGQYAPQAQAGLIEDLNMSLGKYGLDQVVETLNRPSWTTLGDGLSQNEKLRVMKELGITQSQLEEYLTSSDKIMGKAKDSPEYLQYFKSKKSLMTAIWKTVSTEYENNRGRREAEIERYSRIKQAGNQRIKSSLDGIERKVEKIIGDFLGVSKGNALLKSIFALPSGVEEKFKQFKNFREET